MNTEKKRGISFRGAAPYPQHLFARPKRLHKKGALENLRDAPLRSASGKPIQTRPLRGLRHESLLNPPASLRSTEIFEWGNKNIGRFHLNANEHPENPADPLKVKRKSALKEEFK